MSDPVRLDLAEVAAAAARLARTREPPALVSFLLHLVRSWAAPSAAFAAVRDAGAEGGWRLLPSVLLGSVPVGIERTLGKVEKDADEALAQGGIVQSGEEIAGVKARDNWAVPFWCGEQSGALFLRGVPRPAPEGLAEALGLVAASVWPRLLGSPAERVEALLAEVDAAAGRLAAEARRQTEALQAQRRVESEGAPEAEAEAPTAGARVEELLAEVQRLTAEARGAQTEADTLRDERDTLRSRAETTEPLAAEAREARAEADTLRTERDALRSAADTAREEADDLKAEIDRLRERAASADARHEETDAARAEADRLRAEADAARAEADRLRAEATTARAELDVARADAEANRERLEALRSEADSARTELDARSAEADALRRERDAGREQVDALRAERDTLVEHAARADAAREEADAAREKAEALAAELQVAREKAERDAAEVERLRLEADAAGALAAQVAALREHVASAAPLETERTQLAERLEERRRASEAAEVRARKAEEELAAAQHDLALARARAGQLDEERRRRLEEAEASAREIQQRWEAARQGLRAVTAAVRRAAFLPPAVRVSLQEAAKADDAGRTDAWLGAVVLDRDLVALEAVAGALEEGGVEVRTAGHPEEIGLLLRTADAAALGAVVCDVMAFRPDQNVAGLIRTWDKDRPGLAYYLSFDAESAAEVERARRIPTSIIAGHVPRPLASARLLETLQTLARKRGKRA